jgi:hypothetical protein
MTYIGRNKTAMSTISTMLAWMLLEVPQEYFVSRASLFSGSASPFTHWRNALL